MESVFETGTAGGFFLPVKMGGKKSRRERQKRYKPEKLVHTKVIRLMTLNDDPMECSLPSYPP